jgi:hypothetical protein
MQNATTRGPETVNFLGVHALLWTGKEENVHGDSENDAPEDAEEAEGC